jgi:hypothetical protein
MTLRSKKIPKPNITVKKAEPTFKPYDYKELKFKDPSHPNKKFYVTRFKGDYTRDEIKKYAQKKSDELKKLKGNDNLMSITIRYGNTFKAGRRTLVGTPISLWDTSDSGDVEPGEITGFDIMTTL